MRSGRRITLRGLKAKSDQTLNETRALVSQASGALTRTELLLVKLVEQLATFVSSVSELVDDGDQALEDIMEKGVDLEGTAIIAGRTIPASLNVHIKPRTK